MRSQASRGIGLAAIVAVTVFAETVPVEAQRHPYAPKAPIPQDAGSDPYLHLEITSLINAQVPSRSEVEAPPYPGALIIRSVPPRTFFGADGERYETLPVLVLISDDDVEKVVAYYTERLDSWSRAVIHSSTYFWLGEADEFDPLKQSGKVTPAIQVRHAGDIRLAPSANTEIHVRYRPGGGVVSR